MLSTPPADSGEGSSSHSACAPFPEHFCALQGEYLQVGPILSVDALCASAFHPSVGGTGRMLALPPLCAGCMECLVETLFESF